MAPGRRSGRPVLRETEVRIDEPAALAAEACAQEAAGRPELAASLRERWRRLVDDMEAPGLRRWIEQSIGRDP